MAKIVNKNYAALQYAFKNNYRGCVLNGGSRSGKTFSSLLFETDICNKYKSLTINNCRETYNSFKTTLFDDYNNILNSLDIHSPFTNKDVTSFWLLGNKINFIGADKVGKFHGMGSDMFYINEALEGVDKQFFDQMEQRCRMFWWMDFNPSCTDHWIYDLEKRPDVLFVHSTLLDNPHVSKWEKQKILSYDPNNPINIENRTADDYMWNVYGLGLRVSPQGLIFKNVQIIDALPEHYENQYYGIDFGYTNDPTAIVEVRKVSNELNAKLHVYTPIDNADLLFRTIMNINPKGIYFADSADPGMISSLRRLGLNIFPVAKFAGSIKTGIDIMKRYKLNVVRDPDAQKEINNYKWRMINGISLNEPIDQFNHFWDAFRYAVMSNCI